MKKNKKEVIEKLKMYILIRENTPVEMHPAFAAHASLGCYLKFYDKESMKDWLNESFVKIVCLVNEAEFQKAKECDENYIIVTESKLGKKEVAIAFVPILAYPEFFSHLKLWKPIEIKPKIKIDETNPKLK